jgi:hypothetical protein
MSVLGAWVLDPTTVPGVGLTLTWDDDPTPPSVSRLDPDGTYRLVRGGNPCTLDGDGNWLGYDYEAPFDVPVTYYASSVDTYALASAPITLPSNGAAWFKHVLHPDLSVRALLTKMPDLTRAARTGTFAVLNRSEPVGTSTVRVAPVGTLDFRTDNDGERTAIDACFADGTTVVLVTPASSGLGSLYMMPGEIRENRPTHYGPEQVRTWTLAFTVVDRPR